MSRSSGNLCLLGWKLKPDAAFSAQLADARRPAAAPSAQQTLVLLAECRAKPHLVGVYEECLRGPALSFAFDAIGVEKLNEHRLLTLGGLLEALNPSSPASVRLRVAGGLPDFLKALVDLRAESHDAWTMSKAGLVTCVLAAAQGFLARCLSRCASQLHAALT